MTIIVRVITRTGVELVLGSLDCAAACGIAAGDGTADCGCGAGRGKGWARSLASGWFFGFRPNKERRFLGGALSSFLSWWPTSCRILSNSSSSPAGWLGGALEAGGLAWVLTGILSTTLEARPSVDTGELDSGLGTGSDTSRGGRLAEAVGSISVSLARAF